MWHLLMDIQILYCYMYFLKNISSFFAIYATLWLREVELWKGREKSCSRSNLNERLLQRPKLLQDCWQLDLKEWRWKLLPSQLSQQLCFHAATVTPVCVIIFYLNVVSKMRNRSVSSWISEQHGNSNLC